MRTAIAILVIALALCLLSYLAIGWGPVISRQGFEAAITEQSSQPPLRVTAGCLLVSVVLLIVGVSLASTGKGD